MIWGVRIEMKITGFVGSPRKGGNTDVLVRQALSGAEEGGAATRLVYLNDVAFRDCQGCGFCKRAGACRLNDGMEELYEAIRESDGIIVGSPVYFGMMTGTVKSFIDRWYALLNDDFTSRLPPGKTAALILPQGDTNPDVFAPMATHFSVTLEFFGFEVAAPLIAAGLLDAGDAEKDETLMERAYALGQRLVPASSSVSHAAK